MLCIFIFGGFTFSIYALCVAHMNDHLDAGEILEATSGLLLTYGIGATLGPTIVGALMSAFGPRMLLPYFIILLLMLAAATYYFIRVRSPLPAAEQGEFVPMVRTSQAALEMQPEAEVEPALGLRQT